MANNPNEDRFYKPNSLIKAFAIASIAMMVFTLWMVLDDFGRDWKGYQLEFFRVQERKYSEWITEAKSGIDEGKLNEAKAKMAEADQKLKEHDKQLETLNKELVKIITRAKNTLTKYQTEKAVYDVRKYEYEAKWGHHAVEAGDHHESNPKEEAARKKLDGVWAKVVELKNIANTAATDQINKEQEIATLMEAKKQAEKEQKTITAKLDLLETAKKKNAISVEALLRSAPMVDMANPTLRLQQIVLPTIRDDVFFAQVQKVDRCTTCHLAIDKVGYENEPHPFKTHPRLDVMLGAKSPHPIDKIGCTVCHDGRGSATHFTRSAHTPQNDEQEKTWKKKHHWESMHHVIEKMIPLQYTEGKCRVCHRGTEYVPKAQKLNQSVQLIKAAGCYGCHKIEGWQHVRKPAPSLKKIKGKVTRDWVYKWIKNPRSFNEHARMPSSFLQSNIDRDDYKAYQEAEMQAITDFVMGESESYNPGTHGNLGNAERGKELFSTIGCLGCHQIEGIDRKHARFGMAPDLSTVGSKVSKDWLMQWLKNPKHYWTETTMPSLRLTDAEVADLSAFLMAHKNPEFEAQAVPAADTEMQKKVLKLYLERDPKLAPVTKDRVESVVSKMQSHEITQALGKNAVMRYGCFGCHEIKGMEDMAGIGPELTEVGSKPLNKFDFGMQHHIKHANYAWFKAKVENPRQFDKGFVKEYLDLLRMPNYGFEDPDKESLVLALMGMTSQKIDPPAAVNMNARWHNIEQGIRVVHKYNCQGCHNVEGLFQAKAENDPARDEHEKTKYNLEGRIFKYYEEDETLAPPWLLTEGARVQTDWVYQFLQNPGENKLRTRLKVRMPSYNMPNEEWNKLLTYWAAHGNVEFPKLVNAPVHLSATELETAKKLFNKLACASCHTVGEKPTMAEMEGGSKGLAPDLLHAAKRLRRDWIVQLLKDPQKMVPGTRMPGFWPEMQSPAPEILNGDSEKQIQLITDYVIYLGQSRGAPRNTEAKSPGKVGEKAAKKTTVGMN